MELWMLCCGSLPPVDESESRRDQKCFGLPWSMLSFHTFAWLNDVAKNGLRFWRLSLATHDCTGCDDSSNAGMVWMFKPIALCIHVFTSYTLVRFLSVVIFGVFCPMIVLYSSSLALFSHMCIPVICKKWQHLTTAMRLLGPCSIHILSHLQGPMKAPERWPEGAKCLESMSLFLMIRVCL